MKTTIIQIKPEAAGDWIWGKGPAYYLRWMVSCADGIQKFPTKREATKFASFVRRFGLATAISDWSRSL